jgi:hypothetical protein
VTKTLDTKLAALAHDRFGKAFILADAKDADMALGIGAAGPNPRAATDGFPSRTMVEYRANIREIVAQGLVDIMLMSCSTSDELTIRQRIFDHCAITPAVRANDTTDIHLCRGGGYAGSPALPFSSATIDLIQTGQVDGMAADRDLGANLGLYSVTFNNLPDHDLQTMQAYKMFRLEAQAKGFRHFLEVFDPNVPPAIHRIAPELIGGFINDHICRLLAGVPRAGRPIFLKIVYHGPRYMEELCRYDESVIVGVLGGSAGTTYDAFKLLFDAKKYGARAALFGRKINHAEHQPSFVEMLRTVADGDITPEEAVRAYHGKLQGLNIAPHRRLHQDLQATNGISRYGAAAGSPTGPVRRLAHTVDDSD